MVDNFGGTSTMKNIFVIKFCCWLILATNINGKFSDSGEGIVRSGERGAAADPPTEGLAAESAADRRLTPQLRQSELRAAKREQRRHRAAARRAVRERNRRQRMELRQHRQKPASAERSALVAENGTRMGDMEWMKANLSSLWDVVRQLERNQAALMVTSGLPPPHQPKNETREATEPPEQSTVSPQCPPEAEGSDCTSAAPSCAPAAGDQPCSGRGRCCCGSCVCPVRHYGRFCECSDLSCPRHDGVLCGGAGTCECGRCVCAAGRTGDACECPLEDASCRGDDGLVCSNRGVCSCGRCQCYDSYKGARCEDSLYSAGLCEQLKPCVLCTALGRPLPQCVLCDHVTVQLSPELEPSQSLCRMVHSGCLLQYSYEAAAGGSYLVSVPARMVSRQDSCGPPGQ